MPVEHRVTSLLKPLSAALAAVALCSTFSAPVLASTYDFERDHHHGSCGGDDQDACETFTDTYDPGFVKLSSSGTSAKSWTFDITDDGFDPATWDIGSARIELWLYDDLDFAHEYALLLAPGENFAQWEVDFFSKTLSLTALADLDADGLLSVTLKATSGDFYFDKAKLSAEACPTTPTSEVPVPGTLGLLGLGLAGLGVVRRKQA